MRDQSTSFVVLMVLLRWIWIRLLLELVTLILLFMCNNQNYVSITGGILMCFMTAILNVYEFVKLYYPDKQTALRSWLYLDPLNQLGFAINFPHLQRNNLLNCPPIVPCTKTQVITLSILSSILEWKKKKFLDFWDFATTLTVYLRLSTWKLILFYLGYFMLYSDLTISSPNSVLLLSTMINEKSL